MEPRYRVVQRNGWSYVVGTPTAEHTGPWRYRWEAQEYADDLNAQTPRRDDERTAREDYDSYLLEEKTEQFLALLRAEKECR